jgi:hypothetical protein
MKAVVFALICLCAASLSYSEQEVSSSFVPDFSVSGNTEDLSDFLNGVFDTLNATVPEGVMNCFSDDTANVVFQYFDFAEQALNLFYQADTAALMQLQSETKYLNSKLQAVGECLKGLEGNFMYLATLFSSEQLAEFKLDNSLFQQVNQKAFFSDFTQVISEIQAGEYYNAGALLATIFTVDAEASVSADGIANEEWRAFLTGKYFALNLTEPTDIFECFSSDQAEENLEFFVSWASAIGTLTPTDNITNATITFFQGLRAQWNQSNQTQPNPTWMCVQNASSTAAFKAALGLPATPPTPGAGHPQFIQEYFSNEADVMEYYSAMVFMNQAFQQEQYFAAGARFGGFMYGAVKTIQAMQTSTESSESN